MRAIAYVVLIFLGIGVWMIWEVVRRASAGVQAVISPERYAIHKVIDMQSSMLPRETHSRLSPEHSQRWNALLRFDSDISAAAEKVRPLGERWLDELGHAYFALNEDKDYLPNIVDRLTDEAKRDKEDHWANAFRYTFDGNLCTAESLSILREAQAQGYTLEVAQNKTISATNIGGGIRLCDRIAILSSLDSLQKYCRFLLTGIRTTDMISVRTLKYSFRSASP
jgi:hypothetical protein